MAPNGTRFGSWVLDTSLNRFGPAGDYDGDGRAETLVTSAWGLALLKQTGETLDAPMMQPGGTRFGGWLVDADANRFGPAADYDGDGRDEILVTSPWGLGILKLTGDTLGASMLAANGTGLGDWVIDARDEQLLGQSPRT